MLLFIDRIQVVFASLSKVVLPFSCLKYYGGDQFIPLLRPEMKSTFHHTLITLAVVDILFVITLMIDTQVIITLIIDHENYHKSILQRFDLNLNNQVFIMLFPYLWNPFKNILMTFETFLMMSITTERYLAIKNPLEYRIGKVFS